MVNRGTPSASGKTVGSVLGRATSNHPNWLIDKICFTVSFTASRKLAHHNVIEVIREGS